MKGIPSYQKIRTDEGNLSIAQLIERYSRVPYETILAYSEPFSFRLKHEIMVANRFGFRSIPKMWYELPGVVYVIELFNNEVFFLGAKTKVLVAKEDGYEWVEIENIKPKDEIVHYRSFSVPVKRNNIFKRNDPLFTPIFAYSTPDKEREYFLENGIVCR